MADYDRAELERLQAEAAARIREMHARAQPAPSEPAPSRRRPEEDSLPPMPSFVRVPAGRDNGRPAERQTGRQENPRHTDDRPSEREERRFEPMPAPAAEPSRREPAPLPRTSGNAGRGRDAAASKAPPRRPEPSSHGSRETGMDLMKLLNFKNIDLDGDRTLILLILLLLSGEENDQLLTMALLYLLM